MNKKWENGWLFERIRTKEISLMLSFCISGNKGSVWISELFLMVTREQLEPRLAEYESYTLLMEYFSLVFPKIGAWARTLYRQWSEDASLRTPLPESPAQGIRGGAFTHQCPLSCGWEWPPGVLTPAHVHQTEWSPAGVVDPRGQKWRRKSILRQRFMVGSEWEPTMNCLPRGA